MGPAPCRRCQTRLGPVGAAPAAGQRGGIAGGMLRPALPRRPRARGPRRSNVPGLRQVAGLRRAHAGVSTHTGKRHSILLAGCPRGEGAQQSPCIIGATAKITLGRLPAGGGGAAGAGEKGGPRAAQQGPATSRTASGPPRYPSTDSRRAGKTCRFPQLPPPSSGRRDGGSAPGPPATNVGPGRHGPLPVPLARLAVDGPERVRPRHRQPSRRAPLARLAVDGPDAGSHYAAVAGGRVLTGTAGRRRP